MTNTHQPELPALLAAGSMLANCAYNLAQNDRLTDAQRRSLDESRKAWDKAFPAVRATHAASRPADGVPAGMVMVQASDLRALADFAGNGMRGNHAKLAALRANDLLASAPTSAQSVECKGPCTPIDFFNGNACEACVVRDYSPKPTPDAAALSKSTAKRVTALRNADAAARALETMDRVHKSVAWERHPYSLLQDWESAREFIERAMAQQQGAVDRVYVDFPHTIGTCGPFPIVDGRVTIPNVTVQDVIARADAALTTPSDAGGEAIAWAATDYQADGPVTQYTSDRYAAEYYQSIGLDVRPLYATTPPNPGDARLRELAAKWRAELDRSSVSSGDYAHGFDVAKYGCLHELLSLLDGKGETP